jgi:hypothetical protein
MSTDRRGAWKRAAAVLILLTAVASRELARLEQALAAACARRIAAAYVATP